jgi:hypothetical protein
MSKKDTRSTGSQLSEARKRNHDEDEGGLRWEGSFEGNFQYIKDAFFPSFRKMYEEAKSMAENEPDFAAAESLLKAQKGHLRRESTPVEVTEYLQRVVFHATKNDLHQRANDHDGKFKELRTEEWFAVKYKHIRTAGRLGFPEECVEYSFVGGKDVRCRTSPSFERLG